MYSKFLRICSFVLTIVILINLLPMQALGAEAEVVAPSASDINEGLTEARLAEENEIVSLSEAKIVGEIVEGRTEYSKEYLMSNGLNLIVLYPEAVHYRKDNAWEEIDNTLKAVGTGSNVRYTNTAGEWTVSFPQQINSNKCVSISRDGYTLSFGLAGELSAKKNGYATLKSTASNNVTVDKEAELNLQSADSATAIIEERDLTTLRESMEYPETFVSSVFSRMKYDNVYNNTDVVYDLDANSVKESIVINTFNPDLYGYRYTLSTGEMVPVLQDDGSILLYNADRTEVIMTMPAPYMVDNAGVVTYDVDVTLVASGADYLLTYYVPVTWLADENRAWPVILDPVVEAGTSVHNILDHFVAEYYSESNTSGALMCGYNPDFGKMRTFIKFSEIPNLPAANIIVNATLSLTYLGGSSGITRIGVHKINANWETGTITWANQPAHNTVVEDYAGVAGSGRYSWHVTDIARSWYETGNTGIMLKALDSIENGTTENWKKFYSVDYSTYNTERWPSLTITYRNSSGLESYLDYTTVSAGRAGTGYINNLTGNLTWIHDDLGFDGNRMPVAIKHVYNVDDCSDNLFGLGYGWRTNYHQSVQWIESGGYYIWTDGDGTKHELVPGTEIDTYVDQEGLCLELTLTTDSFIITDKYENTSVFDSTGRLLKLVNNQATQSQIEITYTSETSKRIDTIKDGVGRIYKFTYNSSNLLTKIGYHGANDANGVIGAEITNVQFSYSTYDNLIVITYKDALDSHFTYSNYHLTSATDVDGCKLIFTYSSGTAKRVIKTQEYDGTVAGNWMTFEYARNKVKISKKAPNSNVTNTQIRYFNDFGNLISCQDDEGGAEFYQYEANRHIDDLASVNKLTLSSKKQDTVVNLMEHSSFEDGNYWVATGLQSACKAEKTYAFLGDKSLRISTDVSGISAYIDNNADSYPDIFSVPSGKTLTFSAYVLSANAYVQLGLGQGSTIQYASEIQKLNSVQEWKRIEVSYTNSTTSTASVAPLFILCDVSGPCSAYMDCVQVELSAGANRYNLIENGDFRTTNIWSSRAGRVTTPSASSHMDSTVYYIGGNPDTDNNIYQTIRINGNNGDVFVLAGWGKGNPLPETNQDPLENGAPAFGLRADFIKNNAVVNSCFVGFDPTSCNYGDWQYAADRIVANGAYDSIRVCLVYNRNPNSVYFDGIQLYKEEFGERYTYGVNRDLATATDILGLDTTYTYGDGDGDGDDDNDLIEIREHDGTIASEGQKNYWFTKNEYDEYHNLIRSTRTYGTVAENATLMNIHEYTYDLYGNQTAARTVYNNTAKETKATYTSDGNYLATTVDEQGKVTTYSYDPQTGILLWVKNPNDTNTTKTQYTYDSMYRLVNTSLTTDQGQTMYSTNTYSNDLLSKVTTASSIYNFTYGNFDQRTKVAVGSATLASYTYTSDVSRNLKRVDYGNLDSVQYTYDDRGRVVKEEYYEAGSATVSRTIIYRYNNLGNLTYKKDSKTGLATTYFYDAYGRNIGMYENTDSPNASVLTAHRLRYVYDDLGRMVTSTETYDGLLYTTAYAYNTNGQVNEVSAGKATQEYKYDKFERLTQRYVYHDDSSSWLFAKTVNYKSGTAGTSNQISSLVYEDSAENTIIYTYAYDANGNISSEKVGSYTTTYVYDSANQLIRENNQKAGKTWVWTYDAAGNILSKKQYAYTTGTLGSVQSTITYTYGNANWGDLLTKYDGKTVAYDTVGNPLADGTWGYIWEQGRQLAQMSKAKLSIKTHPEDFTGRNGDWFSFTVDARGTGLTYQWQVSTDGGTTWSNSGAGGYNTPTVYAEILDHNPGYLYRCKITDINGAVIYSDAAEIISAAIAIDAQPKDFYGKAGDTAAFSVTARGTGLTYQWQVSSKGTSWADSTASGYSTNNISLTVQSYHLGYYYRCKITDSAGNVVYSDPGRIYPEDLTIVTQPADFYGKVGDTAAFSVIAQGTNLTYQWQVSSNRGASWADSTANGYNTNRVYLGIQNYHLGYYYRCKITDSAGHVIYSEPGEIVQATENWSFTYNADGMRIMRTNGTTTYKYTYHGRQLTHMDYNGTELHFSYDVNGSPMAVVYDDNTYYYVLNLQGDVVGILNSSGAQVVAYTYDAWGRPLSTTGSLATTLGLYNPLRYRGYVYDRETGLYYVSSRYYDPEIGRWINADSQLNTSLGVLGCNMFAYCLNNPVNKVDYGGNKPGDLFDTMDEAAKDAAEYLGELTWENTWEYSTAIYTVNTTIKTYETVTKTHRFLWWTWTTTSTKTVRTKVTKYTYKAVKTDKKNNSVGVPNAPLFKKRVAALHTHPMGSWAGITRFSDADKKWADYYKIPLYVHGPNGELRKYDPATGADILICSDLPISPKTPWLE